MELIERYLQEVGHHLPRKNRTDILGELRSALTDTLEDQAGPAPTQQQVIELLKSFGDPRTVASKYAPENQYLVGPTLFPLFKMVAGIVIIAVIGAQLIAYLVSIFFTGISLDPLEVLSGIVNSLPGSLGWLVIVFYILQYFNVRPDLDKKEWNPLDLPPLGDQDKVQRSDLIVGIIVQSVFLAILVAYQDAGGFISAPGGEIILNPILMPFLPWLYFGLLLGIGIDVYLLWQGRRNWISTLVELGSNVYSIVILTWLTVVHYSWLQERGINSFITAIDRLTEDLSSGAEVMIVQGFLLGFGIALIVTVIETVVMVTRLVLRRFSK